MEEVNLIPCKCKCGTLIPEYDSRGRKREYVNGHGKRGKPCSDKAKKLISIANKGRFLGIKSPNYGKARSDEAKKKMSESQKDKIPWNKGLTKETDERVKKYSVPKTKEHNLKNSLGVKRFWDSLSEEDRIERVGKCRGNTFGDGGYREDIGHYVRSRWEANVARIFKFHKIDYQYEPKTFIFSDGMTYTPDFQLSPDFFVEVKGVMNKGSKIKIDLFDKEFPQIKLEIIGVKEYRLLQKEYKDSINWE